MGLRPGRCYRGDDERPYTRIAVSVHRKNYIGTNPQTKIRQFNMGNPTKEFSHILDVIMQDHLQIRDNAVEAARITINRYLTRKLGKDGYFMRIRQYPHQILRENKMAQGAGADRVSDGMSHSFGRPIGRAIRVHNGDIIMSLLVDEKNVPLAKEALERCNGKFPCSVRVKTGTDTKSIGTRPKFIKEIKEEIVTAAATETVSKEGTPTATGKETGKTGATTAATGKETGKTAAAPAKKEETAKKK